MVDGAEEGVTWSRVRKRQKDEEVARKSEEDKPFRTPGLEFKSLRPIFEVLMARWPKKEPQIENQTVEEEKADRRRTLPLRQVRRTDCPKMQTFEPRGRRKRRRTRRRGRKRGKKR